MKGEALSVEGRSRRSLTRRRSSAPVGHVQRTGALVSFDFHVLLVLSYVSLQEVCVFFSAGKVVETVLNDLVCLFVWLQPFGRNTSPLMKAMSEDGFVEQDEAKH